MASKNLHVKWRGGGRRGAWHPSLFLCGGLTSTPSCNSCGRYFCPCEKEGSGQCYHCKVGIPDRGCTFCGGGLNSKKSYDAKLCAGCEKTLVYHGVATTNVVKLRDDLARATIQPPFRDGPNCGCNTCR